jgi:NO-binding membrane sensor protein with MHYT domain
MVLLAALICLIASFTALRMLSRACAAAGRARTLWLGAGAVVTGAGIWATHFVTMLAFETGLPTGYDIGLTTLSLVIAVIVTGAGFAIALDDRASSLTVGSRALLGGAVGGLGISMMHFVGMAGLLVPATFSWDPGLIAVAVLLGAALSALAVRRTSCGRRPADQLIGPLQLTAAICAMHFSAMSALELRPDALVPLPPVLISSEILAIGIGSAAILVLGLGLIGAVVDQHLAGRKAAEADRLHRLVNATIEGVGICVHGRLVDVNDALTTLLEQPRAGLLGRRFTDFLASGRERLALDGPARHLRLAGRRSGPAGRGRAAAALRPACPGRDPRAAALL